MADTAIARKILNVFRALNSKGIYSMNATETDLLRQILLEVQALSLGGTIADGSVTTAKIADANVTTAKIADTNVTTAKIADANVTAVKLASDAVTTAKILDANVTTAKIADANVTAAKLNGAQTGSAPIYGARAWVNFNGTGVVAIRASGNVSSITDNGTGNYTINFTTAMPDANYAVTFGAPRFNPSNQPWVFQEDSNTARTTSLFRMWTNSSGSSFDSEFVQIAVFR